MQKSDLLAKLDAASQALGAGPITDRMIRDWIDERLLDKSKSKGNRRGEPPTWTYSDETLRRGLRIVELRAQGVRRVSALRINLWIDGFALLFKDMKLALKWEFGRALTQLRSRRPWNFDARYRRNLKAAELHKEGRRIDPVDTDLANAGFAPPLDILLLSGSEAFWGSGDRGPVQGSIEALFSNLWAEAEKTAGIHLVPPAGLFGSEDEIAQSGLSDLARVEERDLIEGTEALRKWRDIFVALYVTLSTENAAQSFVRVIVGDSPEVLKALEKVMRSLDRHEWRVATLAWMVVAALRKREASGNGCDRR
jgi:hypothetical protein